MYSACNSKIVIVLQHSVHIKAISLMAVILRLELWNIQETSRNFLVIENLCGQRVIAEHATYHPTWFMLHIRPFTNETFSLSLTQNLGKYTQFGRSRSIYLLDVLWCQQIKLIHVVSTSEFHENWWNDVDFIFFVPSI